MLELGLPDARIRVKNNIRVFYRSAEGIGPNGPGSITAKIGVPSLFGSGSLGREIRARRCIENGRLPIRVPRIYRYDGRRLRWLEEEYISPNAAASETDTARAFLDHCAERFYGASVRPRELKRSLAGTGILYADVETILADAGVRMPNGLDRAEWPVALGHGDLSVGNMLLRPDGGVVLIDWEKFGRTPVAWDLGKLGLLEPGRTLSVLHALSASGAIEPRRQLQIAWAMRIAHLRANRDRYRRYWRDHMGMRSGDAAARHAAVERQLGEAITRLQAGIESARPRAPAAGPHAARSGA